MTNLLLFLVLLGCLGITAAWIAENPGQVTIHWGDWRIDTTLALIFGAVLAVSLSLVITYAIFSRILGLPSAWAQRRGLKQYKNGLTELTWSVASLAASDFTTAERHAKKAEKLLGDSPMTLLLSAQIARHQGDEGKTQHLLEQMLEHKETEYLAARLLSESANTKQLLPRALALAERAQSASPHDHDAVISLINLHVKMGQWSEALKALDNSARKAGLTASERRHFRGIILLSHAKALADDGADQVALNTARKSLKYLPDFAPAALLAAQCYHEMGATGKGISLLLKTWNAAPHPQVAEQLRALSINQSEKKREKIARKIDSVLVNEQTLWRCENCGEPCVQWHVHCPSCGAFDSLQSAL